MVLPGTFTIGHATVSLNHKRRIFRSSFSPLGMLAPALGAALLIPAALWALDFVSLPTVVAVASPPPANARMVADPDRVAVVDGNTLRLANQVVRLDGVIPPARGETCRNGNGASFDCGVAAANALASLLRQGPVDCTLLGQDEAGRPVATCSAGREQLNRAVVAAGWARAGDQTLRAEEQRARAEHRGLWAMAR